MRAAVYYGPGDIRVETLPDPRIEQPTDALIRVTHAGICGSDLWFYRGLMQLDSGQVTGHEMLGVVAETGPDVRTVQPGDTVIVPISYSDGSCDYCRQGLTTSCRHGAGFGFGGIPGGQAEAARIPFADATLVKVPDEIAGDDDALVRALPLTDVMSTGHHAAVSAGIKGGEKVAVIGDGAVGLCAILAARRLGAEQIIAVGHHPGRLKTARRFGATDIVDHTDNLSETIQVMTEQYGVDRVLECVGNQASFEDALKAVRDGGVIGFVGVPNGVTGLDLQPFFARNISLRGGVTPARTYIPELLEDVVRGSLDPSPILDMAVPLDDTPRGYAAMDSRQALKVLVRP